MIIFICGGGGDAVNYTGMGGNNRASLTTLLVIFLNSTTSPQDLLSTPCPWPVSEACYFKHRFNLLEKCFFSIFHLPTHYTKPAFPNNQVCFLLQVVYA